MRGRHRLAAIGMLTGALAMLGPLAPARANMEIKSGASEDMRALRAADMIKWGNLVKEKNIKIAQ